MRTRRGFSLIETLIAAFVLAIVTTLVFGAISASSRMLNQAALRQGLQSDLGRLSAQVQRDAALSDFWRAVPQARTVTLPPDVRRDGLALVALSDWNDPANYEAATSLPKWNRYVVYYATTGDPGRVIRQVVSPNPAPAGSLPGYASLGANISDNPAANHDVVNSMTISESVRSLEVDSVMANGSLLLKIQLRRTGLKRANSNEVVVESLESSISVRPKNTWPKI